MENTNNINYNYNNNNNERVNLTPNNNKNNINNNNNDIGRSQFEKSKQAEDIAEKLVTKLNAPKSFLYYCKVAYTLPESRIWDNYEQAIKGKNPGGLFNWLCERDGVKRGSPKTQ